MNKKEQYITRVVDWYIDKRFIPHDRDDMVGLVWIDGRTIGIFLSYLDNNSELKNFIKEELSKLYGVPDDLKDEVINRLYYRLISNDFRYKKQYIIIHLDN